MNDRSSNCDGNRTIEGDRLVYHHKFANQGYWEDVWFKEMSREYYEPYLAGKLAYFDRIFKHHLPQNGMILEENGYEFETTYSYAHQNSLSQELHWLKRIPVFLNKLIMRVSKYVPYVNSEWGYMLMVVARKKA